MPSHHAAAVAAILSDILYSMSSSYFQSGSSIHVHESAFVLMPIMDNCIDTCSYIDRSLNIKPYTLKLQYKHILKLELCIAKSLV